MKYTVLCFAIWVAMAISAVIQHQYDRKAIAEKTWESNGWKSDYYTTLAKLKQARLDEAQANGLEDECKAVLRKRR